MLGFYPEQSVPFTLPIHNHLPEGKRPTFYARFLTARELVKLREHMRQVAAAESADDEAKHLDLLDQAISKVIVRAENVPEGFDLSKASHHLSGNDLWTLYGGALNAIAITREQIKKSESPSSCNSSATAKIAASQPGTGPAGPETTVRPIVATDPEAPPVPPPPPAQTGGSDPAADGTPDSPATMSPASPSRP